MPSITDLPVEVLIDNVLPFVPLKDILSLTVASKEFAVVCSDDTFWKRKLKEDYNFSDASSARTKGYKFLYKGVHNAKLYVWGSTGEGRLGLGSIPHAGGILSGSRPWPSKLNVRAPRIVELAAGGWSFHALDSEGHVHVWGQLNGEQFGLRGDSFAYPTKRADRPTKLVLPEKITKIVCGRAHATALSSNNSVWIFRSWGMPYRMTTPLFSSPRQVTCGWSFSAVLTEDGEVFVWWPLEGAFEELASAKEEELHATGERMEENDGAVECQTWEVQNDPKQIMGIAATLPNLRGEDHVTGDKIIKIAGGDNFLIGLTEGGHVLKVDFPGGAESFNSSLALNRPRWQYLNKFSEREQIQNHPTFNAASNGGGVHTPGIPQDFRITHISARFLNFYTYSTGTSSIVLKGTKDTFNDTSADIPPSLQHRDIISVVLGDYHFGALTATGKFLTWGAYSSGALGLGDPTQLPIGSPGGYQDDSQRERAKRFRIIPPEVHEPTEVKFGTKNGGKGRGSFVFGATASGWHTGALVIDMEDAEDDDEPEDAGMPEEISPRGGPLFRGHGPFRIGLAGAMLRGRGMRGRGGGPVPDV